MDRGEGWGGERWGSEANLARRGRVVMTEIVIGGLLRRERECRGALPSLRGHSEPFAVFGAPAVVASDRIDSSALHAEMKQQATKRHTEG